MLVFVRLHHNQLVFRLAFFMFFLLSETCRILEFVQPEEDNYLENHVIKSLMVDNKDQCEVRCYAENFCSSFNFGISETRGKLKFSSKKFLIAGQKTYFATIFHTQQLTATNLFHANQNFMTVAQNIQCFNCFYLEHLIIPYSLWWITYSRRNTSIHH